MSDVIFHPGARAELDEAAGWYDRQQPGLGLRLIEAVFATVERVQSHPRAWPSTSDIHHAPLDDFPYQVVYQIMLGDVIHIVAIAHGSRRPGY
jgi:plasmid stabilization system protein ParE